MAGIEKICEFSGDYPAWAMYGYKRNQLQIMPEYRKLFRGATHTLYVQPTRKLWLYSFGGYTEYNLSNDWFTYIMGRVVQEYEYCLVVKDERLLGRVNGRYFNTTHDIATTKRKMKRLLRTKKLNVVNVTAKGDLWDIICENPFARK